jgi:hypothetical protein
MIRPFTLITMLLAALSGAYLFAVKHKAQVLDDEIAAYSQASRLDAMRIRVLQGQWSLETDPTRLQQLAAQFTNLQPMQPAQLVTLAALRDGLPAPGSAAPASNPALPEQVVPQLAAPEVAEQNTAASGALPLPPPPAPVAPASAMLASLAPAGLVANKVVAHRVSHSALHLANTELAEALPAPKPFYAPRPPREAEPLQSAALDQTGPMGAQVMSVKATGMVPQYVQPVASQDGGSELGMASNLPPPQPLPQNGSGD